MKKQFATLLIGFFWIPLALFAINIELNTSYDYFNGLPDGSWNGNRGVFFAGNIGTTVYDNIGLQAGASYGIYNWDGRQNLVFENPKKTQRQAFITAGLFSCFGQFNAGIVYDRLFTKHFGIYDLNPSIDQLRFQGGYQFCCEEVGIWGTAYLSKSQKHALGVPISFRAISQMNLYWSHFFENCAMTSIWLGLPYQNSLRFHHKKPGNFIAGFSIRASLTNRLFVDGHGSYMSARHRSGARQSRNTAANVCLGITYFFGDTCSEYCESATYLPLANNSNFLVDTNINQ